MIVVAHPKAAPDQFADHRTGPHASLITDGHRPRLDQRSQLLVLLVGQPRLATKTFPRPQTIGSVGLEPLQLANDGAACNLKPRCLFNNTDAIEIAQNRCRPSPGLQIPGPIRLALQFAQLLKFSPRRPIRTDGFAVLRTRHGLDPIRRDRPTMISPQSAVNNLDLLRRDPV